MRKLVDWIKNRLAERTSWDGFAIIGAGLVVLFVPDPNILKVLGGAAVAWGVWTLVLKERQSKI